ncbi:unnamed protein product [Rotaria sp. Silwood1]|nr:unnamed protein product [Rotaria sp. Silwood1]
MTLTSLDSLALPPRLKHSEYEFAPDEPTYDPDIHLSLTEPDFVVLLDGFRRVSKAPKLNQPVAPNGDSQVAYTGPFRLLSDEGYRVLRNIIQRTLEHEMGDERQPAYICYNGYRSKWIQDFNRCPRVLKHLSNMTGDIQLLPTALQSTYSHINIGRATKTNIDAWHCDSVPYVLILLACDMSQTVGGELQLIEREPKEAFRLIEEYKGQVPKDLIRPIDYLGPNSCVFMQGSHLAHRVTGIQSCSELRFTVVNSYISTNPFAEEYTRYDTFRNEITADLEFAMHKTWRANAQMLDLAVSGHPWPTRTQIVDRLTMAVKELAQCRDLLLGIQSDRLGYYDEKKQMMGNYDMPPSKPMKND